MTMVIPVLTLHHDPKYYPEPERFDPERFNEEEKSRDIGTCICPSEKIRGYV